MTFDDFDLFETPPQQVTPQRVLELLDAQAAELTAVAAPPPGHRPDGQAYRQRRWELDQILIRLGMDPPFPWNALTLWEAEAKAEFPSYAGRRQHIKELADPVREQLKRRIADKATGDLQATIDGTRGVAVDAVADPSAILEELRRVEALVHSDPGAAIGKAKNLVEATAKTVLAACGQPYASANVPMLIATAMAELGLDASMVGGHDRVLGDLMDLLAQVALKVNELRNKAGDGHGQATAVTGLDLRHGRLAVRASLAWCAFVLETLHDQDAHIP